MAFGIGKPTTRRREFPGPAEEWAGWLEPGIEMEGTMKVASGLFRMNAHFKGAIRSTSAVVIHDQGEVEGDIESKVVSVTGKVKGTIRASERLEIKEHGVVLGDIYTPCLLVDPGGFLDGQCHMPAPDSTSPAETSLESKPHA